MTIYFDMDGTIANFFGVKGWKNSIDREETTPYEIAEPLYNREEMDAVMTELKNRGYKIGIITYVAYGATKEYADRIRKAKRNWLNKNFPYATEIHMTDHKTPKHYTAKDNGILVDDCKENRDRWNKGATINAYRADLVKELRKLTA